MASSLRDSTTNKESAPGGHLVSWAVEPFFRVGLRCPLQLLGRLLCDISEVAGMQGPPFSTELLARCRHHRSHLLRNHPYIVACLRCIYICWPGQGRQHAAGQGLCSDVHFLERQKPAGKAGCTKLTPPEAC